MNVVATGSAYLDGLLHGQAELPASPLAWLNRLRAAAVDRVGALTVPTTRDEEWRFTDLAPLAKVKLQPARTPARLSVEDISGFAIEEAAARLVFVDGVHAPELSRSAEGLVLANLGAASAHAATLERHLGRMATFEDRVFAALNTAFLRDGALIVVPRNAKAPGPVHLLFIATQKQTVNYPRCLVVAEPGSEATLIEDYVGLESEAYFTNAVTEIAVGDGARIDHVRVQRESASAFHVASCAVSLGNASAYRSVAVALGARLSRMDASVLQQGEGADSTIDGLALIGGEQLADSHTLIDHVRPNGTSRQMHKCIVGGSAHAVFNGKIVVRPGAQRTDSAQASRNLLLSGRAQVDTKPQLEIFADDVKCAHGAAVGQLEAEEVFYLKSRGLSETAARNLLTYAFGADIIDRIPVASLKARLERAVLERTAEGT